MLKTPESRKRIPDNPLVISDLDGTLLDNEPKLTPERSQRLNVLIDRGLDLTIASARSVHIARVLVDGLRIKLPIIEYNGAFITDFNSGEKIIENYLKEEVVSNLMALASEHKLEPMVFCRRQDKDLLLPPRNYNTSQRKHLEFLRQHNDIRLQHKYSYSDWLPDANVILTFSDSSETIQRFFAEIPENVSQACDIHRHEDPYCSGTELLVIQDKDSSKSAATRKLASLLGRTIDEVIAFGDQVNDIALLKESAWGVAVSNASPELKLAADEICEANTEGGVVSWLEQNMPQRGT
jgi:Cof subfamily protein (haloacid dehalogenase superfamily)